MKDDRVEGLKARIERLASPDPERKRGRGEFYQTLQEIPKRSQMNVLLDIFNSQIASDLIPHVEDPKKQKKIKEAQRKIEEWEAENIKVREKARKRYEYIQRCLMRGKLPRGKSPDPMLLIPERPPHLKKAIFLFNLWDLYIAFKKAKLSPIYENLRWILQDFLNVFMEVESIKRELSRMRNDPAYQKHMREYVESKIRPRKVHSSI